MGSSPAGRSASRLAVDLHLHHDELNAVLETLADLGMVARTQEQRWILACDPRRAALAPLFDRFLLDRSQRRLHQAPEILRLAQAVLASDASPTLEDLMQEAHNIANGSADILKIEAVKK
jgi:membrane protein